MMEFNLRSQTEEVLHKIMEYKWLESEKLGKDIGWTKASNEWIENYYDGWFEYNLHRFYGA